MCGLLVSRIICTICQKTTQDSQKCCKWRSLLEEGIGGWTTWSLSQSTILARLHWWVKQDHWLITPALGRGCGTVRKMGAWAPGYPGGTTLVTAFLRTNHPISLIFLTSKDGLREGIGLAQPYHNLEEAKGMEVWWIIQEQHFIHKESITLYQKAIKTLT